MDRIDKPISPELVLVDPELRARLLATEPVPEPPRQRRRVPASLGWATALVLAGTTIGVAHAIVGSSRPSFAPKAPRAPAPAPVPRPHPVTPRVREQLARPPLRRPAAHRPRSTPQAIVRETEPATGLLGPLPDPTPPELRLRPTVASALVAAAMRFHVEWPVLLAAARARGVRWTEASPAQLRTLARRLKHERALGEQPSPEESALARYDGAVGLDALVSGLGSAKAVLAARVLRDPRIAIYPGGRNDIASGRVDVRVLAVLLYLAQAEGSVAVSSLVTGREGPGGERSAHDFGLAVDLRAVAGKHVLGNQTVGGPVERAVRDLLLLPEEVRPLQIVSLLDLGGPSIALGDHSRIVHVGFDPTVGSGLEFLWRTAGASYGVPWAILAAINQIETKDGTFLHTSPAGAIGWMQFMPGTWQRYGLDADGNGAADPWNPADAIFSAARYLAASGASADLPRAILAYNHARWYLNDVLSRAQQIEQSPSGQRS